MPTDLLRVPPLSYRHSRKSENEVDAAYDSSTNDNDKDDDSQKRQDGDSKVPKKGRRARGYSEERGDRGNGQREREVRRAPGYFEDDAHVYCFVPAEGLDAVVLAAYLRWIDGTATIREAKHQGRIGFNVGASCAVSRETLEVIWDDTRKWLKEQSSRDFRREPYHYLKSETFNDRKKEGPVPSSGSTAPRVAKPGADRAPARGRHAGAETPPPKHEAQPARQQRSAYPSPPLEKTAPYQQPKHVPLPAPLTTMSRHL